MHIILIWPEYMYVNIYSLIKVIVVAGVASDFLCHQYKLTVAFLHVTYFVCFWFLREFNGNSYPMDKRRKTLRRSSFSHAEL